MKILTPYGGFRIGSPLTEEEREELKRQVRFGVAQAVISGLVLGVILEVLGELGIPMSQPVPWLLLALGLFFVFFGAGHALLSYAAIPEDALYNLEHHKPDSERPIAKVRGPSALRAQSQAALAIGRLCMLIALICCAALLWKLLCLAFVSTGNRAT